MSVDRFDTRRLAGLRPGPELMALLRKIFQDPTASATLGGMRNDEELLATRERFEEHWRVNGFGAWLLCRRDTGEAIGYCGLQNTGVGGTPSVELLYALIPSAWGKGYATEAAQAVVALAGERLGLTTVTSCTLTTNTSSQRVLAKAGFVYERDVMHSELEHRFYRRG